MFDLPAWRVVAQVTFRRALGAVLGGVLAVAVLAASDMTVTDLLQVRTYAEEAYLQYSLGNGPAAAATVLARTLSVFRAAPSACAPGVRVKLAETSAEKTKPPRISPWGLRFTDPRPLLATR